MNKESLQMELERNNTPVDLYNLNGGLPNEAFCLNENNGVWEVYYSERGVKSGIKSFQSEDDACNYLFDIISKMYK